MKICSKCGNEMFITGGRISVTGDTSPDTETEVWRILTYTCQNPKCNGSGQPSEERIRLN